MEPSAPSPERQCAAAGGCDLSAAALRGPRNGGSLRRQRRRLRLPGRGEGGGRGDAAQALAETDLYLPVPQVWALRLLCGRRCHHRLRLPVRRGEAVREPLPAPWTGKTARCPGPGALHSCLPILPADTEMSPAPALPRGRRQLRQLVSGLRLPDLGPDLAFLTVWEIRALLRNPFSSRCLQQGP